MPKVLSSPSDLRTGLYKTKNAYFFMRTKLLYAQITDIFDEVWPIVTALKTLRWQVRGYHEEYNVPTNTALTKKFVEDDDITNRPNLYRTFIDEDWELSEFRISRNLLINSISCYEAWADDMINLLNAPSPFSGKSLQFSSGKSNDYLNLLSYLQARGSAPIINSWYNVYKNKSKHYDLSLLDNWLKVYRFFKECRNCIVHNGGTVTQQVVDAYNEISAFVPADLNVAEVPQIVIPVHGAGLELKLRGVVGFTQILIRLISTFDVEFIKCQGAEQYVLDVVKESFPTIYPTCMGKEANQTRHITRNCRFKDPAKVNDIYNLFKANGLMR